MRLVFPTDENMGYLSKRGAHFGKANFYTIISLEEGKIVDVDGVENPGHPAQGFADAGLDLYFDRISPTVQESITLFIQGNSKKAAVMVPAQRTEKTTAFDFSRLKTAA